MKTISVFLIAALFSSLASAGVFLEQLKGSDRIYRGRAPRASEMQLLRDTGITSVLIFKNQIKTEVDDEITQLLATGIERKKIHNIPFQWKDIESLTEACGQVVEALSVLAQVQRSADDKILFHCTVGEDRTGLLAGLMSQLMDTENTESSFSNQMCAKGYAGGNPNKPRNVSAEVDRSLTPLYFKMSKLIESGALRLNSLNKRACRQIETLDIAGAPKSCSSR